MKSRFSILLFFCLGAGIFFFFSYTSAFEKTNEKVVTPKECVFNTVFGVVPLDSNFRHAPTDAVLSSVEEGLLWLEKAQHPDGGWGAGFHNSQQNMDPHAVPADPATTATVAMALLRAGSGINRGTYQTSLAKATEYLLVTVEEAKDDGRNFSAVENTQIQQKLGNNIDLVMTTQYLTNLLDDMDVNSELYKRVYDAMNKSVVMVQAMQDDQGRTEGAGWAGVLQSAFATNALESAESKGAFVNKAKLKQSKNYQKSNYDPVAARVETKDGAGVMLYAVSGSARASAKEARKANDVLDKAKKDGIVSMEDKVSYENLVKAGVEKKEALALDTAYKVYESSKQVAQNKEVITGYGNNGGEEFLSFLQTGESLIVAKDASWKEWYNSVSANLLNIQNKDGSWNGHHCITSPVFCTATCLLILSVNNDIEELVAQGE